MKLSHRKSIELLEAQAFMFSNGLDQCIHGMDYDAALKSYQDLMEDLLVLYKDEDSYIELIKVDNNSFKKNINYFSLN